MDQSDIYRREAESHEYEYEDWANVDEIKEVAAPEDLPNAFLPCTLEEKIKAYGLVNIQNKCHGLYVQLKYSTTDNFLGLDVYGCLTNAYLQPDVAEKLCEAQNKLSDINPDLHILVYDAVRPRSVQQKMWDTLKVPIEKKITFLSNPKYGSLHNFGAAVDVTLFSDNEMRPLDMGAPYDHLGELAHPVKEAELLKAGILTDAHISNRELLREVMDHAGFFNIQTEWWHFNSCYRKEAYLKYEMVE